MGMMKRLYEELIELGYTDEQINNNEHLADGWTLENLSARYVRTSRVFRRDANQRMDEHRPSLIDLPDR